MRVTGLRLSPVSAIVHHPPLSRAWAGLVVAVALAAIFTLDRATAAAPVQHLYYVPIVFAAIRFGGHGGVWTALLAIVLYHLANPHVLTFHYEQADVFQMAVFVAVGAVAARLVAVPALSTCWPSVAVLPRKFASPE